ncbi:MAG: DUF1345 domain-containing protein [Mobilicoccus sp.]|nr:DUF1345 domain-containing protein [Mobilicoccus sp.]
MRDRLAALTRASWWLPEGRRAYGAVALAFILTLPVWIRAALDFDGATYVGYALVLLATYLALYVVLSFGIFAVVPAEQCRRWARSTKPGTFVERFILGSQPGAGMATGLSVIALTAVVVGRTADLWTALGLAPVAGAAVLVVLLISSWFSLVLTYAVEYVCRDQRESPSPLSFPGEEQAEWMDYLYFSFAISTTFGTTDVSVRRTTMRRTVAGHGVIAFIFNTVILAVAIGAII